MRLLLDTNVCVAALRGRRSVVHRLQQSSPDDCAISSVTVYELCAGAKRCRYPHQELTKVDRLIEELHELPFDRKAAGMAAKVRRVLESKGIIIGPYDLLLAGQALADNLVLVTHNQAEFRRVSGLKIEDWE